MTLGRSRRSRCRPGSAGSSRPPGARRAGTCCNAVISAPAIARPDTATPVSPSVTIANTANALAPYVTPMMSGLASGLRAIALEDRTGQTERGADQDAGQGARQPELVHDELGRPVARPNSVFTTSMHRDLEVAQGQRDAEAWRTERSPAIVMTSDRRLRPAGPPRRPRDHAAPAVAGGGRSPSEVRQLAAADQGDEERAHRVRGDDADLELAGPGDDPAEHVASRAAGSEPAPSSTAGSSGSPGP